MNITVDMLMEVGLPQRHAMALFTWLADMDARSLQGMDEAKLMILLARAEEDRKALMGEPVAVVELTDYQIEALGRGERVPVNGAMQSPRWLPEAVLAEAKDQPD